MSQVFYEFGLSGQIWPGDHEPPHVHVYKDGNEVILFFDSKIRKNHGMKAKDISKAKKLVAQYQEDLKRVWERLNG